MIGIDTNVLLRYVVRDDEAAFQVAANLILAPTMGGQEILVGSAVLLETEWVLRSRYKYEKNEVVAVFEELLATRQVRFDDEPAFEKALHFWKKSSADFADCMIVVKYQQAGCSEVVTFDKKASSLTGTRLLKV